MSEKEAPVSIGAFFAVVLVKLLKIKQYPDRGPLLGGFVFFGTVYS